MLYVVATPIGNLSDMSPRAVETLRGVSLIAAEDTRHTMKLLNHFDIHTPLISYHQHNERERAAELVRRMQEEGISLALVTDAGTPAISDPGAILVRASAEAGIEVIAIPGPSAVVAALSVSGILSGSYRFLGFPPREKAALRALLEGLRGGEQAVVFYESPHRVDKLMQQALEVLGDVEASLSCDLSKLHEKTLRGPLSALIEAFSQNEKARKGEYVLALDLSGVQAPPAALEEAVSLEARLVEQMLSGLDLRAAQQALAAKGEKKNALYQAALRLKGLLSGEAQEKTP